MTEYEQNAEAFEHIMVEVGSNLDPKCTEADTRVKLIDRILHEALAWSEHGPYIQREEHVHEGYIDYTLQAGSNFLIIEAKRIGETFLLPSQFNFEKHLSVKNLLSKQIDIRLMYDQVIRYAHERGIQYCSLTNGTQWLVFPGVRTDNIHIRHSRVIVFNGLESIRNNFLDFWRLLSFESVRAGNLQHELEPKHTLIEPSFQFNAEGRVNIPYDRNPLALPLIDVLPRYFGDLHGDPSQTDMLQECFVLNDPVQEALTEVGAEAGEEKPSKTLTAVAPIMHFYSLPLVAERLNALIESFIADQRAHYLQVLLGRVGIGKTTFLLYFFNIHKKDLSEKHFTLYLDFRDVSESTDIESFFSLAMWNMLTQHKRFSALTSTSTLKAIFKDDIGILERGPLERLKLNKPEEYEEEIARYLSRQFADRPYFLKQLADFLYRGKWARFILVFDNVDQLPLDLQEKVIRFAWTKATEYRAFLILSMWEETYFSSKRGSRVLSTMRTVPLQIARQSVGSVLVKRLQYLMKQISEGKEALTLLDESICNKKTFCKFLDLILRSLLVDNKRVRTFLELVALGNIRRALEMFHSFLTAGSLETGKILEIMRKSDEYLVPEHEFIKSVMLGSKRFYSENTSDIANLFVIGDIEKPSHFTRLRILQWLYERRHESTQFGLGFRTLDEMVMYFNSVGVSEKDVISSVRRLTESALIENDLRAQKWIDKAQAVRITPTGRYYLTHLYRQFPYIDLVIQDIPFFDHVVFAEIAPLCEATDMPTRFQRCERFLDYIEDQEEEELVTLAKLGTDLTWRRQFTPNMRITYTATKRFIISKGHV